MKRKITISSSYSGVIPVAQYANARPGFSAQEEFEIEFSEKSELNLIIEERQRELMAICLQNFTGEAEKAKIQKIKNDLKEFRFYKVDGEEYPSVTTVAGYDRDFFVGAEDLKIYAAQGNIIDAEIRNFVRTGEWKDSKDLLECTADRFILKSKAVSSGKMLALSGWNFRGFLEKYPIAGLVSIEKPVYSRKHRIAGTPDLLGNYNGLKTLVSIKRTASETDNFIQEAGYSLCEGLEDVGQFMVVEMKAEEDGGNQKGWSKPIITTDVPRYQELFLSKRSEFLKIYGV